MSSHPPVHVVVLNHNGLAFNEPCLRSLASSAYPALRILLVDNGSDDGSVEWVERNRPDVAVLRTGINGGWASGNNAGIRRVLGEGAAYVWLLNNDTELEPDCLPLLVDAAARDPVVGLVSPRIRHFADRKDVWFEGGEISREALMVRHCDLPRFRGLTGPQRYVSGCAMLVRREVFERIGLIDDRFFMYYEDADFCLRAAAAGFRAEVVPDAILYHKVAASSGGVSEHMSPFHAYHILRSEMLFWRKHLGFRAFHADWCARHLGKWVNLVPAWAADERTRPAADAIVDAVWSRTRGTVRSRERRPAPCWFRKLMRTRPWLVARLMSFGAS
jgi:GT2 family glycosyltransferase